MTETNAGEHFVLSPVQAGGEGPAALQQGCPACSRQGVVDDSEETQFHILSALHLLTKSCLGVYEGRSQEAQV